MTAMNTRSKACKRSKQGPCKRLQGHKGDCRPTLTKAQARTSNVVEASSADRYTVLPEAGPEGRDVQRIKSAKRARRAPASTRSRSNKNALKGRMVAK
jgi:hypothetical protein